MNLNAEIAIEYQPMNPPKPTGFGVIRDRHVIAVLTYEQVRIAMDKFATMQASRELQREKQP